MKQPNSSFKTDANETKITPNVELTVSAEEVKKIHKTLALTVDSFALLLGVSPSSIFRYENVGSKTYQQGPVARKLCLLSFWLKKDSSLFTMKTILAGEGGLAILAGLLEAGNVLTHNSFGESTGADGQTVPAARPSIESLAERILRAFYQDEPLILTPDQSEVDPNDRATQIENEARIMEAEARKLEAQARKLEAQTRLKSAQESANF
ncbi:MAG: hypothetical protein LBJ64_01955 [Deltaproteobacteria bacterium]|jgi:hypothetical protein|nr:hypothetical protein [Deltaproteobacteria bacterium]